MGTDGELAQSAILPIEQDTIDFYGHPLVAVRLPDGRVCAVLRWICDGLRLDPSGQVRRIQRKTALADGLVYVRVHTEGGPQTMPALTLRRLPGWFYTIDESRVKEEARVDVILFQRECTDVLAEHFARKVQIALPAPTALVPSEPQPPPPVAPAPDAPREAWRTYHERMLAWLDWQDAVERWQNLTEVQLYEHEERLRDHDEQIGELHSRVEGTEELSRVLAEALTRLGTQTLTPEHQATIKHQATRLREL